ncbi:MAG: Hpt domain-containing protein [Comamonadaceae bacterium]|nr:Hpt domain-containing protein [Comamonadaceae bacterium]
MLLLDTERALRLLGGNLGLYRRTLRGFAQQYGDGIAGWDALLAAGRWAELRRAAHTLQGLAGTIGAPALRESALDRRNAWRKAAEDGAVAAALPALGQALAAVVAEIDAALDAPPGVAGGRAAGARRGRAGRARRRRQRALSRAAGGRRQRGARLVAVPAGRRCARPSTPAHGGA